MAERLDQRRGVPDRAAVHHPDPAGRIVGVPPLQGEGVGHVALADARRAGDGHGPPRRQPLGQGGEGGVAEALPLESASADAVVCTLTLCSGAASLMV